MDKPTKLKSMQRMDTRITCEYEDATQPASISLLSNLVINYLPSKELSQYEIER